MKQKKNDSFFFQILLFSTLFSISFFHSLHIFHLPPLRVSSFSLENDWQSIDTFNLSITASIATCSFILHKKKKKKYFSLFFFFSILSVVRRFTLFFKLNWNYVIWNDVLSACLRWRWVLRSDSKHAESTQAQIILFLFKEGKIIHFENSKTRFCHFPSFRFGIIK